MANFEPTEAQIDNLIGLLDGYAEKGGHHLNCLLYTSPSPRDRG